jgi:tryptophan-rich hypothetical protein
MNELNIKKLQNSKWTAVVPKKKEKHFIVTEVEYNEEGQITSCQIEAVYSKRQEYINWQDLKLKHLWKPGWVQ